MAGYHINNQDLLDSLISLILANLGNENFGARELARAAGMSQRKLSSRIRAIKSMSVSGFIREVRLQKAFGMLHEADLTAAEVAYKVGFGSATYFNKCFHEFFGFPPGKIRKEADNPVRVTLARKISGCLAGRFVSRRLIYSAGGIILILLLIITYNYIFIKNSAARDTAMSSKNTEISIAVLPFRSLNDSTEGRYFIDGLMDEIHTSLGRIHSLRVISRKSAEQFRGSASSAPEISKRLKVDYLVTGSGQKYDNSYQLRVQLIDGKHDRQLWAESYKKEIKSTKDIFDIQSQIAQAIAAELKATITPEEKGIIEKIPTTNLTAYDFYLRGKEELDKMPWPQFNTETLKKAETLFRNALAYDSSFARAYSGLGHALWIKLDLDQTITETNIRSRLIDSLMVLSDIALSYDDKLAEAYIVRSVYYGYKLNLKKQIEELDKAIRYNPNDWFAYYIKGLLYDESDKLKSFENFHKAASLGHCPELNKILIQLAFRYYNVGFPEMGDHLYLEVLKLDGDSLTYFARKFNSMGAIYGNYQKSIELYKKFYLMDSTRANVLIRLGFFNALMGNYQQSLKYYKKYISESELHGYSDYWSKWGMEYLIGYAFGQNGYRKESDLYFDRSIKTYIDIINSGRDDRNNKFYYYRLAGIYAFRGDKRKAYENLNKMNNGQIAGLDEVTLIKMDPLFNSIRNEPEFKKIVSKMEVSYQAEHERVGKWLEAQGQL
jgi:TolB-like protein/AraC-like DNA-binding protein/tetratricopeptide (TPR) repeat protein